MIRVSKTATETGRDRAQTTSHEVPPFASDAVSSPYATELHGNDQRSSSEEPMTATISGKTRKGLLCLDFVGRIILAIGLGTTLCAAYLMRAGYSVVPYWDELDEMIRYVAATHGSTMSWIWSQHNEHRILPYKLLFLVNMHWFRGRNWPMYAAIFCSQLALAIVFGYLLQRTGEFKGFRSSSWQACFGLTLYCLFCPSQWENLTWAFQISFVLVNLWAATALLCFVLQKERLERRQSRDVGVILVSALAATAATFTNGNGMTVWLVLIVLAFIVRLPWRFTGIYILGLAGAVPFYLIGYHSPAQHASPFESLHQPRMIVEYVANYIGGGLVSDNLILLTRSIGLTTGIGLLGLLLAIALVLRLAIIRGKKSSLEVGLAGVILYCIATALITSLGRLNFGTTQAFTSRYQSIALLFWLSVALWIMTVATQQSSPMALAAIYLVILVITAYSATQYDRILERVKHNTLTRELAGIGMISGVHDDQFLEAAILPFSIEWPELEELRAQHLSVFSTPRAGQFGGEFVQLYPPANSDGCQGEVNGAIYIGGEAEGLRIFGWAIDRNSAQPVKEAVFASDGRIVGFGVLGLERPDVAASLRSKRALHSGWVGYAKLTRSRTIDMYAVLPTSGEDICRIGTISTDSILK